MEAGLGPVVGGLHRVRSGEKHQCDVNGGIGKHYESLIEVTGLAVEVKIVKMAVSTREEVKEKASERIANEGEREEKVKEP